MYRTIHYIALFATLLLVQIFIFDNLALSPYFNPLIYVTMLVLMPMESRSVVLLFTGLALGLAADFATGGAGLNTAATLPAAFLRQPLLALFCDRDDLRDGGVPSAPRMGGEWNFMRYAATVVAVQHAAFFMLESMSAVLLPHVLLRTVLSAAFTLLFVFIAARLFTYNISRV
ncbi:MAG: rod shape-determining protein MreD [Alistipes sp.]|nr:rod shape-determining protein MreD [Alistipes sp.]MDE6779227.1 rod shape-determining protein MreD [Alistipes sp.]MDE6857696.1 rod shape-determining protein MreD [Alistipes sp.]